MHEEMIQTTHDSRNTGIVDSIRLGESASDVARNYGLSRERVRQIVKQSGFDYSDIRSAQKELSKEQKNLAAEQRRKARIFSVAKHTERERNFSDQDIVDALARVAQELGVDNLSRFVYDKHRSKEDPSTALITSRLSSWNNAVESAGLKSFKRGREYTSRWTDQEVIQWISKFLNESSGNGGIGAYELWSKQYKKEAPSASSIRVRKPGMAWSDWKAAALKDMGV